jgi:hypothetical protein
MKASILLVTLLASSATYGQTVQEMMSSCRTISEGEIVQDNVRFAKTFASGQCWGAFAVLQDLSRWVNDVKRPKETALLDICSDAKSTRTQYIGVFMEHARRNPARWHEEFTPFAVESLSLAFRCR